MYTSQQHKKQLRHANKSGTAGSLRESAGIPNFAALSMHGDGEIKSGDPSSADEVGRQILARQPGVQPQIPEAEREADALSASVTCGSPQEVKAELGRRMGADFSGVRFHTDGEAQAKAASMNARAYTSGSDVYFGQGGFDPAIAAHELVHTVQQGAVDSGVSTLSTPAGGVQQWPWSKKKKTGADPEGRSIGDKIFDRVKKPTKSIFDWAERRSGHQADPAETAEIPLALDEFFEEDLTAEKPKKKWYQKAGSWIKDKASSALEWGKDKVAGALTSLKRRNDEAVDQFNTNQEDYQNMPLHQRILWSIKNPIARLTASRRKKGTEKRMAEREEIGSLARQYTDNHLKGEQQQAARERRGETSTDEDEGEEGSSFWDVMEDVESYSENFAGDLDDHYDYLNTGGASGEKMSLLGQGAGILQNGVGVLNAGKQIRDQLKNADEREAMGDQVGALTSRLRAAGSGAKGFSSGVTMAQYLKINEFQNLSPMASGASAAGDFINGTADTIDAVDSGLRMKRMTDTQAELERRLASGEKLSANDDLMLRMARQGAGIAKADTVQYGSSAAGNMLKGMGGIVSSTGAGAPIGAAISGLGTLTENVGGSVAASQRKDVARRVANEEFDVDKRIERYMKKHPGVSPNKAKKVVLNALGFRSGKRSEAFAQATIQRVDQGLEAENAGSQEMGTFFDRLSVPKVNGARNRDLAGERLGLRGEGSLEERKEEIAKSRDLMNPFKAKRRKRGAK